MGRGSSKAGGGSGGAGLKGATGAQLEKMNTMKSLLSSTTGDTISFAMQSDGTIVYTYTNSMLNTRNIGRIYKDGVAVIEQSQSLRRSGF